MTRWKSRRKVRSAFILAIAAASSVLTPGIAGAIVSDNGRAFEPAPVSEKVYADPGSPGETTLEAVDGTKLVVEYWRPRQKEGGPKPPRKVPVVVFYAHDASGPRFWTPTGEAIGVGGGVGQNLPNPFISRFIDALKYLVPRGYAMVYAHARGSGRSDGCLDFWADLTADDGSRIIEWAGTQKWSTGSVGMYGLSTGAINTWATALTDDPQRLKRIKYLKAIVPLSGFSSMYDAVFLDGAPNPLRNTGVSLAQVLLYSSPPPFQADQFAGRACTGQQLIDSANENSGDFTPYWEAREHRDGLANLRAATLIGHGLFDPNVLTRSYIGLLDRWPEDVPLKMLLGIYGHSSPDTAEHNPDGGRKDWLDMLTAWYDRYLKDLDSGVEDWPAVQVQDARGQWRQEGNWVRGEQVGARDGALALSSGTTSAIPGNSGGGVLGAVNPSGSTTYLQAQATGARGTVSFATPPLKGDLRILGDPVLDVSLKISDPNAKIGARLDVLNEKGEVQGHPYASTYGARSMRHLGDLVDGRFAQKQGVPPKVNETFTTTIRFNPTDMLVPAGWHLRLSFFALMDGNPRRGGAFWWPPESASAHGSNAMITILHNCENPTVLRFAMADPDAPLLNVRDSEGPEGEVKSTATTTLNSSVDGQGLARSTIC